MADASTPPAPPRPPGLGARLAARLRPVDWAKTLAVLLPFLCLGGYAFRLPVPVPAFLLPERCYVLMTRGMELSGLRRPAWGEAVAVVPDRLVPLGAALDGGALPEIPDPRPVVRDLEWGLGPFQRARVRMEGVPLASELAELEQAADRNGVPLAIESLPPPDRSPIQALGVDSTPRETRVAFDLLLAPGLRQARSVEVRSGDHVLFRATGPELPADLVLRLSVARTEAPMLVLATLDGSGRAAVRPVRLGVEAQEPPKVLVITEKGDRRSFLEALYPVRRATPAEAAILDLLAFELVVVDGIPIRRLQGRLLAGLREVAQRRTGSLLFVADSPEFGRKGDNPGIEELLPATLLPRDLKALPDLAVLILIDVSGSMFGDKLSLAKVTGLELLRNLKPGDLVGMMLFSDERRWVYGFQPNASITAAPALEPLTAGGGTDLYPALAEGLQKLAGQAIPAKHVVLVTDGVTKPADFQALADRARELGISISAMGVGADVNRALLERLSLQTGGRYYTVGSVDEIPGLLFEDRTSETRAAFRQGRIPVLAMNGDPVATLGGMAQYTPLPEASVLFSDPEGDPLLAEREQGNRAVLLFTSDLYGGYTAGFFASPLAAGAFKDRLDALFARRPAKVRVVETARGVTVLARSDSLVAPVLLLSKEGRPPLEAPFRRNSPSGWAAETVLPFTGLWHATILDRGGSLAAFQVAVNGDLGGARSDALQALAAHRARRFRPVRLPAVWLGLFFLSSLACTVVLRVKR